MKKLFALVLIVLGSATAQAQSVEKQTFTLSWKNAQSTKEAPIEGTLVERQIKAFGALKEVPFSVIQKITNTTAVSTKDEVTGPAGQEVCYRVRHFNSGAESVPSNTACGVIEHPAPVIPPELLVSKTSAFTNEPITVEVEGGLGGLTEWVALNTVDAPTTATSFGGIWQYLNGTQTKPDKPIQTPVTLTFIMPPAPGTYTLRFYANATPNHKHLVTSAPIVVSLPPPLAPAGPTELKCDCP